MTTRAVIRAIVAIAVVGLVLVYRPDKAVRVATGLTAKMICSQTFVSGFDPKYVYAQSIAANPGTDLVAPLLRYTVDRDKQHVDASLAGFFSAHAVHRKGLGCRLKYGDDASDDGVPADGTVGAADLPDIAGDAVVEPQDPNLRAALDTFLMERDEAPHRWVKAVVILKDGKILAERYAPGIGKDTPIFSYSMSKSMTASLLGILVRDGKLKVADVAPVPDWSAAKDPRHTITIDNLLRMTSGLAIEQNGSGFDFASRMLYTERDMAGSAQAQPLQEAPGTKMAYSDGSTLILSRIIRDATGGNSARFLSFARRELLQPLGMTHVVLETDATGTYVGATGTLASARDWARLGLLYLNDGMAGQRRILPLGWVTYVSTSTLGTSYGAGFWTNAGDDEFAKGRIANGMPCDTYFASGNLGQRVYIIPSSHIVIVRLAVTQQHPDFDIAGDYRLIKAVMTSTGSKAPASCPKPH